MAHVGTPMDLAKQPATTSSNGLWHSFGGAILVVTLGIAIAMGASLVARANIANGVPAADHSYDKIEGMRGAAVAAVKPVDRGYDDIAALQAALRSVADGSTARVEALRGAATFAATNVDRSYDDIEALRAALFSVADKSYDKVEGLRGAATLR